MPRALRPGPAPKPLCRAATNAGLEVPANSAGLPEVRTRAAESRVRPIRQRRRTAGYTRRARCERSKQKIEKNQAGNDGDRRARPAERVEAAAQDRTGD